MISTYENESALIQSELKKLYETVEHDRTALQQYEALIKEQQVQVEKLKKKLKRYEQWVKVRHQRADHSALRYSDELLLFDLEG